MSINFVNEDVKVPANFNKSSVKKWVKNTIITHGKKIGAISFIFCSDQYLLEINIKYLQHDYFTDVITFDYVEGNVISGDIFISLDRVSENATEFGTSFINELHRIIIHGVLHLLGYNDITHEDKLLMTSKEDYFLDILVSK